MINRIFYNITPIIMAFPGASPGFGRGGQEIFFSDLGICMSRSDMLRIARGVRGHAPPEKFF